MAIVRSEWSAVDGEDMALASEDVDNQPSTPRAASRRTWSPLWRRLAAPALIGGALLVLGASSRHSGSAAPRPAAAEQHLRGAVGLAEQEESELPKLPKFEFEPPALETPAPPDLSGIEAELAKLRKIKLPELKTPAPLELPKIDVAEMPKPQKYEPPELKTPAPPELPKLEKYEPPELKTPAPPELPKFEAPEMPKFEPPEYELPKYEPPKYEMPKYELPKYEPPKIELPKYEAPPAPKVPKGAAVPSVAPVELPKMPEVHVPELKEPVVPLPKPADLPELPKGDAPSPKELPAAAPEGAKTAKAEAEEEKDSKDADAAKASREEHAASAGPTHAPHGSDDHEKEPVDWSQMTPDEVEEGMAKGELDPNEVLAGSISRLRTMFGGMREEMRKQQAAAEQSGSNATRMQDPYGIPSVDEVKAELGRGTPFAAAAKPLLKESLAQAEASGDPKDEKALGRESMQVAGKLLHNEGEKLVDATKSITKTADKLRKDAEDAKVSTGEAEATPAQKGAENPEGYE